MAVLVNQRPVVLSALAAFVVFYAVGNYAGLLGSRALLWWSDMAWTIISLAAALKCLQTASRQKRPHQRRAWVAFGLGALSWFTGMLIWDYLELVKGIVTPFPSLADYFFLALAPAFGVGIFYYRERALSRYMTLAQIGNMGIIVCTLVIVSTVILYPQIQSSDRPQAHVYFSIAYAVVFMSAFLFALFSYWRYRWNRNRLVVLILLATLLVHAVADTIYGFELLGRSYGVANYLNVAWIVAFALQYWAAVEQDALAQKQSQESGETASPLGHLEGLAPSLSMLAIIGTLWAFGEPVSQGFVKFLLSVALLLMVFLVMQEWSIGRALASARANLEGRVRERTRELTLANRELEAYSYSIAHDLRAPLRAITGFSQVLLDESSQKLDEHDIDHLERIVRAGNNMAQLIDEILELARVRRADMVFAPVDLSVMSRAILRRLCEGEPQRKVEWSVKEGMVVRGDEQLLMLAIQNLLDNAFKYTAQKASAWITVGSTPYSADETVYYVRDNGAGFDMQYADQLFKPFHRLHGQEQFPGSGVGLAIVERIIERHGGRIWAEACLGQGATFFFTLAPHKPRVR